jgi:hypothetical protein
MDSPEQDMHIALLMKNKTVYSSLVREILVQ